MLCWIGFTLFSKVSKIREIDVFEKIIAKLNKRLSIKEGVEKARALFPIDSTVISLTSKLLWQKKMASSKIILWTK